MTNDFSAPRRDDGFTLIEILVAMTLSVVVLLATLQSLDRFNSDVGQQTRLADTNETARRAMDRVVDDLRSAATIRTAASTDLVYSVDTPTGYRAERLCVGGTSLYRSASTTSFTPGTTCGTAGTGWTQIRLGSVPASTTTAFTYDGATSSNTPSSVRGVGITLNLEATGGGRTATTTLRASATVRRAAGQLPVNSGDIGATCNSSGPLLSLGAGLSGLNIASVTYSSTDGVALGSGGPSSPVQLSLKGAATILATITDAAGITSTVQKTVECS